MLRSTEAPKWLDITSALPVSKALERESDSGVAERTSVNVINIPVNNFRICSVLFIATIIVPN